LAKVATFACVGLSSRHSTGIGEQILNAAGRPANVQGDPPRLRGVKISIQQHFCTPGDGGQRVSEIVYEGSRQPVDAQKRPCHAPVVESGNALAAQPFAEIIVSRFELTTLSTPEDFIGLLAPGYRLRLQRLRGHGSIVRTSEHFGDIRAASLMGRVPR
jgi:hypothetical protein